MPALDMRTMTKQPANLVADTTPYPWPYDSRIEASGLALVVLVPGGAVHGISSADGDAAMAAVTELASAVVTFGAQVLVVTPAGPLVRRGQDMTASGQPVGGDPWSPPTELLFPARSFTAAGLDGFFGSQLDSYLRGWHITHLLLAGVPLETAVHSTMRTANDQGYECLLVHDATAALDSALKANTLSMVEMSGGIFGAIGTTAAVLAALAN
jgi:nicotinamidase-related amidase